jgi:chemotaxis protein MotB
MKKLMLLSVAAMFLFGSCVSKIEYAALEAKQ